MAGLAVIALLRPRAFLLFAIAGIALALHLSAWEAAQRKLFETIDAERFVVIEAPIDRDWSARDGAFLLRTATFRAGDRAFDAPLSLYARFDPPPIGMEATVRAEGFLRLSERGQYTVSIKSPELLSYRGALPWWQPKAWNRALANRLRRHVPTHPEEVALAQALVLGRGELLTDGMRESFRRGGTYHLLVFSACRSRWPRDCWPRCCDGSMHRARRTGCCSASPRWRRCSSARPRPLRGPASASAPTRSRGFCSARPRSKISGASRRCCG